MFFLFLWVLSPPCAFFSQHTHMIRKKQKHIRYFSIRTNYHFLSPYRKTGTLQGTNISHLEKRKINKIIFKHTTDWGYVIVPRRVSTKYGWMKPFIGVLQFTPFRTSIWGPLCMAYDYQQEKIPIRIERDLDRPNWISCEAYVPWKHGLLWCTLLHRCCFLETWRAVYVGFVEVEKTHVGPRFLWEMMWFVEFFLDFC